ncbi:uncharacterized protein LDX57_012435 [Aspergillus melleus]|uniref:uncharacterized protein n=1 Tax=Aspergillus melleus TaxID=138277 RepID=UPI001E8DF112|nr:uncharacterized protein LDX57_012435 [Aspergillus melleus]KAH8434802.1 hypothetical protein LDX57_012435 [Aspergillus melleus]
MALIQYVRAKNAELAQVSTVQDTANQSNVVQEKESSKMSSTADVDDTAGFMAAARTFMLSQPSYTSDLTTSTVAAEEAAGEQDDAWKSVNEFTCASTSASVVAVDADDAESVSIANGAGSVAETPKHEIASVSNGACSFTEAGALVEHPDQEEDRENLTTFETWGTPAARAKPGKSKPSLDPLLK